MSDLARIGMAAAEEATSDAETKAARTRVHEAKVKLGERGPVWWNDGAKDVNRYHPKNTKYADWWSSLKKNKMI